jgi:aldehyde dehydrogenase (NAD+)
MAENPSQRSYDELFIGGHWRKPANPQQLVVISPHSEEPIGHVQVAVPEDVEAAVTAARRAFDHGPWPRMDVAEQIEKVAELASIYGGHIDEMADLITAEMGSRRSFSRLGQAAGAASMIHLTLAVARDFPWMERRRGVLVEAHLSRTPVGVVGAIVPWNVPQCLIMPKLIPALIAGCPVCRNASARNTVGRFVVGRDDRAGRLARRGGICAARRDRGR